MVVAPINIHDEILCVTRPDYVQAVADTVQAGVEFFRPQVALIGMSWVLEMLNWAEKKSGSKQLHITYKR
jgi:hypothetical protein